MRHSDHYDAWLIDLDGTLYWQAPVRMLMAAELLLLAPHRIPAIRRFRREQELIRRENVATDSAVSPYQLQLERASATIGCSCERLGDIVRSWMEQRPAKWLRLFRQRKLLREIRDFHAAGGKTAVVSDYPARHKLDGMGIASLFDQVVANGEADGPTALKPDPAGFLRAAELLRVLPDKCLVIGDRDDADGEAARRAGIAFRLVR
jgi:HAD superfamily hydrolase (TIGR01549 family)